MKRRELISRLLLLYGGVLILLSFQARFGFTENEYLVHERSEGGLVYGLLFATLGVVLLSCKDITMLKFLWIAWAGMFLIQVSRLFLSGTYVSRIMHSIPLFWGTVVFGILLLISTIIHKRKQVF